MGLRVPAHPVAHALLGKFGGGIAAPSANRFGRLSPTTAQHVRDEFGAGVDLVLDGGASEVGIESTIVDATGAQPVLLRAGHITAREIELTAGVPLAVAKADAPRAPGGLAAHYAPETALQVMEGDLLLELAASLDAAGQARRGARAQRAAAVVARPDLDRGAAGCACVRARPLRQSARARRGAVRCDTGGATAAGSGLRSMTGFTALRRVLDDLERFGGADDDAVAAGVLGFVQRGVRRLHQVLTAAAVFGKARDAE